MKIIKILLLFVISFGFVLSVSAREKTFSLIEYKDSIYYDGRYLKEENFKKEMDFIKDKKYQDTFLIQNDTKKDREIFLLLENISADGSYNDIMEYCHLTVSLDDKIIYDGSASGMDYTTSKGELYDFVSLGKIEKKEIKKLVIELVLSSDYPNLSQNKFAYVTPSFYLQDEDKSFVLIEEATPQMIYNFLSVWIFCGVCVFVALFVLSIFYIRKHPLKKKEKEDKEKENNSKEKEDKKE